MFDCCACWCLCLYVGLLLLLRVACVCGLWLLLMFVLDLRCFVAFVVWLLWLIQLGVGFTWFSSVGLLVVLIALMCDCLWLYVASWCVCRFVVLCCDLPCCGDWFVI